MVELADLPRAHRYTEAVIEVTSIDLVKPAMVGHCVDPAMASRRHSPQDDHTAANRPVKLLKRKSVAGSGRRGPLLVGLVLVLGWGVFVYFVGVYSHSPLRLAGAAEEGLQRYLAAVSVTLGSDNRDKKLDGIAEAFSIDCELVQADGTRIQGRPGVRAYFDSDASPVLQTANFSLAIRSQTQSRSVDRRTIAVEVEYLLPDGDEGRSGNWFTFSEAGLIDRLRIFSGG